MRKRMCSMLISILIVVSTFTCLSVSNIRAAGVSNIVARANYMYNSTWVCQKTVSGWRGNYTFSKGSTYRIPYGQPVDSGAYIGYGVSVTDFLTAAGNSSSVFYTSQSSYSGKTSTYYASDCSAFVSYAWGATRHTTSSISSIATSYGLCTSANVSKIQVGDALNLSGSHVVLVTGITYSGSSIASIEITEQTPPQLKRTTYTSSSLVSKYSTYTIYRYNSISSVPEAPTSSSSSSSGAYFPAYTGSSSSLTEALSSLGIDSSYSNRKVIAAANNITDYSGTAAQNTTMLNLLKAGTLINPDGVSATESVNVDTPSETNYFPAYTGSSSSLTEALSSLGIDSSYSNRKVIAAANNITDYSGTAAQNTTMLNLLKAGTLINPDSTTTTATTATTKATTAATTATTKATTATTKATTASVTYYPAYTGDSVSLVEALTSLGIDSSYSNRTTIANANGISDYSGSATQNSTLLSLLKSGKLINPSGTTTTATTATTKATTAATTATTKATTATTKATTASVTYYPAYTGDSVSLVEALTSLGIDSSYSNRTTIANANGITDYSGSATQNSTLLSLLKSGKLINPSGTTTTATTATTKATTVATTATTKATTVATTATTKSTTAPTTVETTSSSVTYYPTYTGDSVSLVEALTSLGIDSSYSNRTTIANANGITDYSGSSEQNSALLKLLKAGKLINPDSSIEPTEVTTASTTTASIYYPAYTGDSVSLVEALTSLGIDGSMSNRTLIASANGISDYSGTSEQNTALLNLLKNGKLVKPDSNTTTTATTATTATTVSVAYYPAYTGDSVSLVETLTSLGIDSSYSNRTTIANANGISDYSGSSEQNSALLKLLKAGKLINPDSSIEPTEVTTAPTTASIYYPEYTGDSVSLVEALTSLGIDGSMSNRTLIASANGISDYTGTSEQNTALLKLLKAGKLVKPDSTTTTTATTATTKATTASVTYYPAYTGDSVSLVEALTSLGIDSSYSNRTTIANANGITDYSGSAEQNSALLKLLKAGTLINPSGTTTTATTATTKATTATTTAPTTVATTSSSVTYYPAYTGDSVSLVEALTSLGIDSSYSNRTTIANANGITDYSGSAEQNSALLKLLKAGTLINPSGTTTTTATTATTTATTATTKATTASTTTSSIYYPQYTGDSVSLVEALTSLGIDSSYSNRTTIANANGISDYSGSATQNSTLLSLLKAGTLINPENAPATEATTASPSTAPTVDVNDSYPLGREGDGKIYARGIDVSKWQGSGFDFQKIKDNGYTFVILRCGNGSTKDPCFEEYYANAKAVGLNVGAYFYSKATTASAAKTDAEYCLSFIQGKKFEYPIYYDFEDSTVSSIGSSTAKSVCLSFMDTLSSNGYLTGLYSSASWLDEDMSGWMPTAEICKNYECWVARYYDSDGSHFSSTYSKRYGMYQYTSSAYIGGVGPLDADMVFKDYPAIVSYYGLNGYSAESQGTTEATNPIEETTEPTTEATTTETEVTTVAPTTVAPTTEAPTETLTTVEPTTETTEAPTTVAPTTETTETTVEPTTEVPTTIAPTTEATEETTKATEPTTEATEETTKATEPTTEAPTEPETGVAIYYVPNRSLLESCDTFYASVKDSDGASHRYNFTATDETYNGQTIYKASIVNAKYTDVASVGLVAKSGLEFKSFKTLTTYSALSDYNKKMYVISEGKLKDYTCDVPITLYYVPTKKLVDSCDTFYASVKDSIGAGHRYDFTATEDTYNGLTIYKTVIRTSSYTDVQSVGYVAKSGSTFKSFKTISPYTTTSGYDNTMYVLSDGKLIDYAYDTPVTLYYVPNNTLADTCDTFYASVKDTNGVGHRYDFTATEDTYNGQVIYKTVIRTSNYTDIQSIGYVAKIGSAFKSVRTVKLYSTTADYDNTMYVYSDCEVKDYAYDRAVTLYYVPNKALEDSCDTFYASVKDSDGKSHRYDFTATDETYNGQTVYVTTVLTSSYTDIQSIGYVAKTGDTFKSYSTVKDFSTLAEYNDSTYDVTTKTLVK